MSRSLPVLDRAATVGPVVGPEAEGWTRRFVAMGERLAEATELYRELGFEVRLERPGAEELREECGDCRLVLDRSHIVYTRRLP
jgi:hypothetical protein